MHTKDSIEVIYWLISLLILGATVYYIATGPIHAVKIGRQLNNEQQKDNAKRNLFLLLFSLRGSPLHYDFVRGLNQIAIVFEDTPPVLEAWHQLFVSLNNKNQANAQKNWEILRVNLLSAMATALGYSHIQQTEMMQDYYPEGHDEQLQNDQQFRKDLSLYLRSGIEMQTMVIEQMKANLPTPNGEQK